MRKLRRRRRSESGFTLPEVLVVISILVLLMALLLPAFAGTRKTSLLASSQNNLRQIGQFMRMYSEANRDAVVPSQFDYSAAAGVGSYPIKVRSDASLGALQYKGTWTDILWTTQNLAPANFSTAVSAVYAYDSPDRAVYDSDPNYDGNVLRSAERNQHTFPINGPVLAVPPLPKPFGPGAQELNYPGYFAANNFFNASNGVYFTNGQIKSPERSMYLVDSFAGETIEPNVDPFNTDQTILNPTLEVDFRYNDVCLMLMLDSHVDIQSPWVDLCELEVNRRVKVRNLTTNQPPPCP